LKSTKLLLGAGERNWSGECARSSSISPLNLPLTFYTEKSEALDNSLPFKKSRIAKNSDYLLHSNDLQFLFDDVPSQKVSLHGKLVNEVISCVLLFMQW